jgi:hypothetical protein
MTDRIQGANDAGIELDVADHLLDKADALLRRHRDPAKAEAASDAHDDLPILTDIVPNHEPRPPAMVSAPARPPPVSPIAPPLPVDTSSLQEKASIAPPAHAIPPTFAPHPASPPAAPHSASVAGPAHASPAAPGSNAFAADPGAGAIASGTAPAHPPHAAATPSTTPAPDAPAMAVDPAQFDALIARELRAWLDAELPTLIEHELGEFSKRLRAGLSTHLRSTLVPRLSAQIANQLGRKEH